MAALVLQIDAADALTVVRFDVRARSSSCFVLELTAVSHSAELDLRAIVGAPAVFHINGGTLRGASSDDHEGGLASWSGICNHIEQLETEPNGVSTYSLRVVPNLWVLTQRRNYRVFQHLTIPEVVTSLLEEWGIKHVWELTGKHPKLEYRVQYSESDFDFMSRLLEEAGITYLFRFEGESILVLCDEPQDRAARSAPPVPWREDEHGVTGIAEFVANVRLSHEVRPGAVSLRDYDLRRPAFGLFAGARSGQKEEDPFEQYFYEPGGFLIDKTGAGDTPAADDQSVARHDQATGDKRAQRALDALRFDQAQVSYVTNVAALQPGVVFSVAGHPHSRLDASNLLIVTEFEAEGTSEGNWGMRGVAVFADRPMRPKALTAKPVVSGVDSATVVGPAGDEIYTDEFGRVRVQFPWDRKGKNNERSSCWLRVSQGWAGTGFGSMLIPRVGEEVLVSFLGGDPDQPIIVGRVFNATQPVPYELPQHKTRSTWKSQSSPGGGGFNEIMFEDMTGRELVYIQAERNLRQLVKNDESVTIGSDRQKLVKGNETETTRGNRTEATLSNRVELTMGNRLTTIQGDESKLVCGNEFEQTNGEHRMFIGRDAHSTIEGVQRVKIAKDSHLRVMGDHFEQVDDQISLTAKSHHIHVGEDFALETGEDVHLKAASKIVIEADDITLKAPGGFIRIGATGIIISGARVRINSGGSPGKVKAATPQKPEEPKPVDLKQPELPVMDDVSQTLLGQ